MYAQKIIYYLLLNTIWYKYIIILFINILLLLNMI